VESGGKPVSDVILDDARKSSADLIVMGTHGRRGVNRMPLGSDAERAPGSFLVPVLLIRVEEGERRAVAKRARARTSARSERKPG
jgi:nucleotide-binding universal stress UspA family protein